MLIHPGNVGRPIVLNDGNSDRIVKVTASREGFRVQSEVDAPTVNDYSFDQIAACKGLVVSHDGGLTWLKMDISVTIAHPLV